ncbi:MAG: sulfatase-like hydrolase/transferase [Pirellulaceae bacterium]
MFVLVVCWAIAGFFENAAEGSDDGTRRADSEERPNIVVLFADDAGYADFGFQPNVVDDIKSQTPRIDSIAKNGMRFSNAYVSGAVCSPSRAGLMTGRYQQRFGHETNIPQAT